MSLFWKWDNKSTFFFSRFSQLREFSLHHWTKNVNYAVDVSHQDIYMLYVIGSGTEMFIFFMFWVFCDHSGRVAVLPLSTLPHAVLLHRSGRDGLPKPWSAQPVSAELKSPVYWGRHPERLVSLIIRNVSVSFFFKLIASGWKQSKISSLFTYCPNMKWYTNHTGYMTLKTKKTTCVCSSFRLKASCCTLKLTGAGSDKSCSLTDWRTTDFSLPSL